MSTTPDTLPPRSLRPGGQLATVYTSELRRLLTARKTIALVCIQLLPALVAVLYVLYKDVDGLTMFRNTVEHVVFPFLLPLAALFYGGPTIVDEMEGRTLTYLTLRPIPRAGLFLAKYLAGTTVALLVVLGPLAALFGVALGTSSDFSATLASFGFITLGAAMGVVTYTAIFAALGVIFATSLLSGILYFVGVEMVLATLPVLELLSVKYYVRTIAGLQATERLGVLDRLVLDEPLAFEWWVGLVATAALTLVAVTVGAYIFRERQYHV